MIDSICELHGIPIWQAEQYTELQYTIMLIRKNLEVARSNWKPPKGNNSNLRK